MHLTTRLRRAVPEHSPAPRGAALSTPLLAPLLLAAIFSAPTIAAAAPAAPPPAEVFGAVPQTAAVVMTPDGKRLAWLDQRFAKPRVVMVDIAARKELRILALPENLTVRSLLWNDNETLIVLLSETQAPANESQRSRQYLVNIAYDASGGDGRLLPSSTDKANAWSASMTSIVRANLSRPHTVIMWSRSTRHCPNGGSCLIEVDTSSGDATVIKYANEHTVGWIVGRDGVPVAREDWDWKARAYRVYALSGENIREILRRDDSEPPRLAGILPDNSALVLLTPNGHAHQAAWALPLDGSPLRLLAEDPDADITGTYSDSNTGAIVGVYASGSETRVNWLDPEARQRAEIVQRAFPGKTARVVGWSPDGVRVLAEVQSRSSAPVYYLIDFSTHRADIAADTYPALENVPLGELKELTYKARDGTAIPAYLTLPPGKPAGPVPLVVLPHSGPGSRDYPVFDWFVQFLATRGYAVLQPQFRGSIGFGAAFEKAGYRQWGGLMQDDVTDGVQAMIDEGIADPHHIAIVGFYYGGYAALAGAAFTPTLYSCAVSVNGISDLVSLVKDLAPTSDFAFGMRLVTSQQAGIKERIGSVTDSAIRNRSPINAVAAVRIPILIAYGTGAQSAQSEHMADALRRADKPVTLLKLPQEDYWMSSSEARVQLLKAVESFLHDHI